MNKQAFVKFATQDKEYQSFDGPRRDLAIRSLEHAWNWYIEQPTAIFDKKDKDKIKKSCKAYILKNFHPTPTAYGYTSIFTSWLFYLVLRYIISWVIKRLIDDWLLK